MFARIKINLSTLKAGTTATTINIPISLESQEIGQAELIETVFVDTEIKKAINPISDYDKVRFLPIVGSNPALSINYLLNLTGSTDYKAIGFEDNDIKFEKSCFKQSFLYLGFFDSPNPMTQRLISYTTIFSRLNDNDLLGTENDQKQIYGKVIGIPGQPVPANEVNLEFIVENPILKPMGFSEGYHIYDYRNELNIGESKFLYMRSSFKNAKTGKSTNLMVKQNPSQVNVLVKELYTRYILYRDTTGYYYQIDNTYQGNTPSGPNNVLIQNNNIRVNLYQIQAL